MKGETEEVLARAEEFLRLTRATPGILARSLAETNDGAVLVTLWSSPEARASFHRSAQYRDAISRSGVSDVVESQTSRTLAARFTEVPGRALSLKA